MMGKRCQKKGVIFISINYRVGVFGFLAHPELSSKIGCKDFPGTGGFLTRLLLYNGSVRT
jgi:para-nitrobenzyl esterase